MHNYILTGMQFGDEGKGSFVDWLTDVEEVDCIVRYNGGCHASHTVINPEGVLHKYSQLGSGMFRNSCHTYLTENMVVDLAALKREVEIFSKETNAEMVDIMKRVHIHENCYVVTPYHRLMNMIREFSLGKDRRSSGSVGVSEVKRIIFETSGTIGIQIKEIFSLDALSIIKEKFKLLQQHVFEFYKKNYLVIWNNVPEEMEPTLRKWIVWLNGEYALDYEAKSYIEKFGREADFNLYSMGCIYSSKLEHVRAYDKTIYEGGRGLLIDYVYGTKPDTSCLNTTIEFAIKYIEPHDITSKIGVAKAICSRHGAGAFPTEVKRMSEEINDDDQEVTYLNGRIRFGWFDAVLFRYAQSINKVNEIYLSSLDLLNYYKKIKICNSYIYNGEIDESFKKTFSYYIDEKGRIIITDINGPNNELGKYLEKCIPKYIVIDGWNSYISNVTKKEDLPKQCLFYIKMIEFTTSVKISVVSVGPTRENKIRM